MKATTAFFTAALLGTATTTFAQTSGTLDTLHVTGEKPLEATPVLEATTGTRIPTRILDTDRSIQVVNRDVLETRAINDPQEAVQNMSGVQRASSYTGIGETYIVRGFFQQSLIKDGFRAGAAQGGSLFSAAGPTDVANLERVEVLKGPSAILYGRGEPGGTVNYVTRLPSFANSFELTQQVGSYDFYRTQLNANWAAVPGKLALRLDAAYENSESFIDYVEGERTFLAPAVLWQIGPDTVLTFRGERSHDNRNNLTGLPYADGKVLPGVPYNRYFGEPDVTENETTTFRGLLSLEHRWNESHQTTFSFHALDSDTEGAYFILFNFAGPLIDPVTGNVARALAQTHFEEKSSTARLDHLWDWTLHEGSVASTVTDKNGKTTLLPESSGFPTIKNRLLFSAEFTRQKNENLRLLSSHAPLNPFRPVYTGYAPAPLFPGAPDFINEASSERGEAFSLLLLDQLSIGEHLILSFGGRYEWLDSQSIYNYTNTAIFPSTDVSQSETTFNPTAGLVIKPTGYLSLYGSFSESTNSLFNFGLRTVDGDALDPERARQFEIGAKAELLDRKLLLTAAVFQIEKSDVSATDPANPLFSINAGEERSRGVEFDAVGEPLPGWRVMANYAYIDARVTDDPNGLNTGNRRFGTPENSGAVFTTYEFQNGALRGFGFGGGVYLSDRVEIDTANSGHLPGYAQVDAVAYYKRDHWKAQINVKNFFDNEIYYSQNDNTRVVTGVPLTLIGSISYKF